MDDSSYKLFGSRLVVILLAAALLSLALLWNVVHYPGELTNQPQSYLNTLTLKRLKIGVQAISPKTDDWEISNDEAIGKLCPNEKNFLRNIQERFRNWRGDKLHLGDNEILKLELDALNDKLSKVEQLKAQYYFNLSAWIDLTRDFQGNRCKEAQKTVAELKRGSRLSLMAWGKKDVVPNTLIEEPNPWGELSGCVYIGQPFANTTNKKYYRVSGDERICADPTSIVKKPWRKDENIREAKNLVDMLPVLQPLNQYTSSRAIPFRQIDVKNENVAIIGDHERRVGYHALLTIDPELQEKAQQILDCYVGKASTSAGCPSYTSFEISNSVKYEDNARVKMAGLAVIDINTGEILAAASNDAQSWKAKAHVSKQNHHALQTAANPGSTAKIIVSASLVNNGFANLNELHHLIKTSNSEKFQELALAHPLWFKNQAKEMGWNTGCEGDGKYCGIFGELYGKPLGNTSTTGKINMDTYAPLGRIIVEPISQEGFRVVDDARLRKIIHKSKEENIIEQAAIGHGDTLATPVGVAHYVAYIGASALGKKQLSYPHLVKGIYDISGKKINELSSTNPDLVTIKMPKDKAQKLIGFMESTGKDGGTAGKAYAKVFGASCKTNCVAAGKTGTTDPGAKNSRFVYKWYAGLYKSKNNGEFDRAIVVLIERGKTNLKTANEDAYFRSLNKAAEIGFEFIKSSR